MITKGFVALQHVPLKSNLVDDVTKHWSHASVYDLLIMSVFNYSGDTEDLYIDDTNGPEEWIDAPTQEV